MAEYLYVIEKIGTAQSVCDLSLARYKIIRETDRRWYVHRYAEEIYIPKSQPLVFTDLQEVVAELRAMKARQLVETQALVKLLKQGTSITLIKVPFGGHLPQEGPISI